MQPNIDSLPKPLIERLSKFHSYLSTNNIEAYIIGGFLRDFILGRKTSDIDITISEDPLNCRKELAEVFGGKDVALDSENKILRIILPKEAGGNPHPEAHFDISLTRGNIKEDLGQRDFTINAMALELGQFLSYTGGGNTEKLELIDPFNGTSDIQAKNIKTINSSIFQNDAIRLLRAVRLSFELRFSIEKETKELVKKEARFLSTCAQERVRDELLKLADIPFSKELWPTLDSLGLLTAIFPELELCRNVEQPREHTWPVLYHSINTAIAFNYIVRQGNWEYDRSENARKIIPWTSCAKDYFEEKIGGYSRRALVVVAALLHDVAKPQTKTYDETRKRTRFTGHPKIGSEVTLTILKRLRFSKKEIRLIASMVRNHLRPVQMSSGDEMPSQRAIYRYFRDDDGAGIDTLYLSLADHLATRGPNLENGNWQHHVKLVDYILSQHETQVKRLKIPSRLINGHEIMRVFSLKPGSIIKNLLEELNEARASGKITTKEQAFAYIETLLEDVDCGPKKAGFKENHG